MEEKISQETTGIDFSGEGTISGPGLNKELAKGKSKKPLIITVFIVLIMISLYYYFIS